MKIKYIQKIYFTYTQDDSIDIEEQVEVICKNKAIEISPKIAYMNRDDTNIIHFNYWIQN